VRESSRRITTMKAGLALDPRIADLSIVDIACLSIAAYSVRLRANKKERQVDLNVIFELDRSFHGRKPKADPMAKRDLRAQSLSQTVRFVTTCGPN
jgi:hypothetical protein